MKHSEYIAIVESYGETALKKVLMRVVISKLPFLALGPGNILLAKLCAWLAQDAIEEAEMRVFFEYIDLRTDSQAKEFEAIMIKNHTIQQNGTEEEKAAVEKELETALTKLVNLNK